MKLFVNVLIGAVLVFLFAQFGWITLGAEVAIFGAAWANQALVAVGVSLLLNIGFYLAGWLFGIFVLVTCFVGCLLIPVYWVFLGPAAFWFVGWVLPTWMTVNVGFWGTVGMGFILRIVRWHDAVEVQNTQQVVTTSN